MTTEIRERGSRRGNHSLSVEEIRLVIGEGEGQQNLIACVNDPHLPCHGVISFRVTFNKIQKSDLVGLNVGSPWQPCFGGDPSQVVTAKLS